MQLFLRNGTRCEPIEQWLAPLEVDIHQLMGANLMATLGLTLIAHEFDTGHGRMDTLCIDEAGGPVIIEYKRGQKDNVINQALFYQSWLNEHRADFERLVERNGPQSVDWTGLRIICIASAFSTYDQQAIGLFKANIDLIEYAFYGQDLLALTPRASHRQTNFRKMSRRGKKPFADFDQKMVFASDETKSLYMQLMTFIEAEHLPFSVQERSGGVEIVQGEMIAKLSLKGSATMRLQCFINYSPDELKAEMDSKWHPGLDAYRKHSNGFNVSVFDQLSLDAIKAILVTSARLRERAQIWS
jgi:hypothetical protein